MSDRDTPSIHIPQELADAEGVPDDLDSAVLGPYVLPSPTRRRISGWVYVASSVAGAVGALSGLPAGMWVVAAVLLVLGIWHFITAWPLAVDDSEALELAAQAISFPVGHSSGAVRFEGWRSRPVWNVLLYAADNPPSKRGLVLIDAVTGEVRRDPFEEVLGPEA